MFFFCKWVSRMNFFPPLMLYLSWCQLCNRVDSNIPASDIGKNDLFAKGNSAPYEWNCNRCIAQCFEINDRWLQCLWHGGGLTHPKSHGSPPWTLTEGCSSGLGHHRRPGPAGNSMTTVLAFSLQDMQNASCPDCPNWAKDSRLDMVSLPIANGTALAKANS